MNITMESLQMEIMQYQRIIDKYDSDPEYVNPNCSLQSAKIILEGLCRELYLEGGKYETV